MQFEPSDLLREVIEALGKFVSANPGGRGDVDCEAEVFLRELAHDAPRDGHDLGSYALSVVLSEVGPAISLVVVRVHEGGRWTVLVMGAPRSLASAVPAFT